MPLSLWTSPEDTLLIGSSALNKLEKVYSQKINHNKKIAVEVSCVDLAEMQAINAHYRGLQEPTDVLSFPLFNNLEELQSSHLPEPLLLGSIVLCPEKAVLYNESLPQLVHHGLLHLLGFDHEVDFPAWQAEELPLIKRLASTDLIIPPVTHDSL